MACHEYVMKGDADVRMTRVEWPGRVMKVELFGSLDIRGAAWVDLPLNAIAGAHDRLAIDLRGVDFLASIGVRTLVSVARVIGRRGGQVVFIGPNQTVAKVLSLTGLDTLATIAEDDAAAQAVFA